MDLKKLFEVAGVAHLPKAKRLIEAASNEDAEFQTILDRIQNNMSLRDACEQFLNMSEEEIEDADFTYWDECVKVIMADPELKQHWLGND